MKKLFYFLFITSVITTGIFYCGCEQTTEPSAGMTNNNATDQLLNKAYQTRPFAGEFVYVFLLQINDSVQTYYASGTATHFGYCTVIDTTIYHYTQTGLTVEGRDWITVASGELVHEIWFMDYFDPTSWVWEIIGGTGRFAGATGSGSFITDITATGDLWVRWTGSITY